MLPTKTTTAALCVLLFANCTDSPQPQRGERTSLMQAADRLQDTEIVTVDDGPWQVRRIARPAADDRAPAADIAAMEEGRPMAKAARKLEAAPSGVERSTNTPLRAGSTDDNADHAAFLKFLEEQRPRVAKRCEWLEVADRRSIRVVDRNGAPLPAATVSIVDEGRDLVLWRSTTYGDGRAPFYPGETPPATKDRPASQTWLLEVRYGDTRLRQHWDGQGDEFVVKLPTVTAPRAEVKCDVVFLIDTTGSMGDEIARIKATLRAMTAKLQNLDREFDLRYGAVLYRDVTDQYVTKRHPFTDQLDQFDVALQAIAATGGGDTPESMNQGLAVAIDDMQWRDGAAKIVFLIADAPPHVDYENDVPYRKSLQAAVARGIRIHTVAASGLDMAGTVVFRQVAHFTRGKFIFIEYGGVAKTAAGHGVTGKTEGNNLDDILYEQIRDEIAHWGRPRS